MYSFSILSNKKFECNPNCGQCCDNLLSMVDGKEYGVYLTPEEIQFFPEGTVFPLFRRGGDIFAYQIGQNRCPNLVDEIDGRKTCKIYENRPLECRAFPGACTDEGELVVLFEACPYATREVSYGECFKAVQKQIEQAKLAPQATEMFALNGKKWVPL